MANKRCIICNEIKEETEFYSRVGRTKLCPSCKKCYTKNINNRQLEKYGTYRNYNLVKKYGITVDDYDAMYETQKGRCLICDSAEILFIDHNHKTGQIRGLLCHNCNVGIGHFKDDPKLLSKAKEYVS